MLWAHGLGNTKQSTSHKNASTQTLDYPKEQSESNAPKQGQEDLCNSALKSRTDFENWLKKLSIDKIKRSLIGKMSRELIFVPRAPCEQLVSQIVMNVLDPSMPGQHKILS